MPGGLGSRADASGHKPGLRLWFLLCSIAAFGMVFVGVGAFMVGLVSGDPDVITAFAVVGYLTALLAAPLHVAALVIAMIWLHGAWRWLPPDQRFTRAGRPMGPDQVFYLLIPYFHYYWVFPINLELCHAMNRMRDQRFPTATTRANADTAMWAAICSLVPIAIFVAPFLWAAYMKQIDAMHDEMGSLGA
jgi:hypothetical protein